MAEKKRDVTGKKAVTKKGISHRAKPEEPLVQGLPLLGMKDVGLVGGKNASLGQMIRELGDKGILVPSGFAVTARAYWYVIESNELLQPLKDLMAHVDSKDVNRLASLAEQARELIEQATMPDDLVQEIEDAYRQLSQEYGVEECDVAVRSSATAEDSPEASFAGQQETFLNVKGANDVVKYVRKCMASLFTDRAIVYRIDRDFDHFKMAISVGVQKMVRSDKACSGVMFTLDTESGFKDVVVINATPGLGENLVQGHIVPDEFYVHKPLLEQGYTPIVKKTVGTKLTKKIYGQSLVIDVSTTDDERNRFSLSDEEVLLLARQGIVIEQHYSQLHGSWMPMDIEWAKDGDDDRLYIIQARPETVHARVDLTKRMVRYRIKIDEGEREKKTLVAGQSIGHGVAHGRARVVKSLDEKDRVAEGEILVTHMTDPDWLPAMKKASAIVTVSGGRTCHAAIVSRELGIPAIVGAEGALDRIVDGQEITVDCSQGTRGVVYQGVVPFTIEQIEVAALPQPPVPIMVNIGFSGAAYLLSSLPVDGVGLARIEFAIAQTVGIHPMALLHPDRVDEVARTKMKEKTKGYADGATFFVESLAYEMGTIAAAFWPRPVMVRFSDFKSNEYRGLVGGTFFEPLEENPMLGFRGASRYYHEQYRDVFALECRAMKKVRDEFGFENVIVMIPFIRTVPEAEKVLAEMKKNGLERGKKDLKVFMMIEVPADVILIEQFSDYFDGFSLGSNDLTQAVVSVDRSSPLVASLFSENDPAVRQMLLMAIEGAHRHHKYISICGQGPSDYPELASYLIKAGIDALSLNPDAVIPFLMSLSRTISS